MPETSSIEVQRPRRSLPGIRQWGALYPFDAHFLQIGPSQLHYLDEGPTNRPDGPERTLLFVHGNPTWSFHWRQLIHTFRDQVRCVAPDHLGCGYSDLQPRPLLLEDHINHLRQLIEQLDLRNITLIAQDWGGAIGLGAVLDDEPVIQTEPALNSGSSGKQLETKTINGTGAVLQDRLERIILLNTGAFPPWFIPWRIRACRFPGLGRLGVQGLNLFSRAALRMTLSQTKRLAPEIEQAYLAPYDRWARRAAVYQFVRDIPTHRQDPTWRQLERIESALDRLAHLPQLLIWGMRDWCFNPTCLEKFIDHWPDARVARLEDVGHWVAEDAPEEVESLVRQFLFKQPSK